MQNMMKLPERFAGIGFFFSVVSRVADFCHAHVLAIVVGVVAALAAALGWYIGFRFDLLGTDGVVRMSLWNAAAILMRRI